MLAVLLTVLFSGWCFSATSPPGGLRWEGRRARSFYHKGMLKHSIPSWLADFAITFLQNGFQQTSELGRTCEFKKVPNVRTKWNFKDNCLKKVLAFYMSLHLWVISLNLSLEQQRKGNGPFTGVSKEEMVKPETFVKRLSPRWLVRGFLASLGSPRLPFFSVCIWSMENACLSACCICSALEPEVKVKL